MFGPMPDRTVRDGAISVAVACGGGGMSRGGHGALGLADLTLVHSQSVESHPQLSGSM